MTGKYAVPDTTSASGYSVVLEGNFWPPISAYSKEHAGGNWYDVPYRIMLPKKGTGANLLVPVALSASAVAFSSTRIENMYMSIGSAAGVASKQLVDGTAATVQEVDVSIVQSILNKTFHQRIHGPPGASHGGGGGGHYTGPKSWTVVGAGSKEWNGEYKENAATLGIFYKTTAPTECSIYSYGGVWRIGRLGKQLAYESDVKSATPPLTGWQLGKVGPGPYGVAPAPHLIAGPDETIM
jgi:hypothetical protein